MIDLPLSAIGALRERGFLGRGEDDDATIAEALLEMLSAAWRAGIRAEDAAIDERKREYHARLAAVNREERD